MYIIIYYICIYNYISMYIYVYIYTYTHTMNNRHETQRFAPPSPKRCWCDRSEWPHCRPARQCSCTQTGWRTERWIHGWWLISMAILYYGFGRNTVAMNINPWLSWCFFGLDWLWFMVDNGWSWSIYLYSIELIKQKKTEGHHNKHDSRNN